LSALPRRPLANIKKIFVEQSVATKLLAETPNYVQYGSVARLFLKSPSGAVA
jgi:hypothetical protein